MAEALLPNFESDLHPPFSPIEKAALSLMREDYPGEFNDDGTLTEMGQFYWREKGPYYVRSARAVLAAIREPSEAMREPFTEALHWDDLDQDDVWQTMIEALLAEVK